MASGLYSNFKLTLPWTELPKESASAVAAAPRQRLATLFVDSSVGSGQLEDTVVWAAAAARHPQSFLRLDWWR